MDGKAKKKPKQARAKARVKKILSCTEYLLTHGELKTLSTTTIAQAAGIPVGSIYQYFESKSDILTQLYLIAYRDIEVLLENTLVQIDHSNSFEEIIEELLRAFWSAARIHPTFRVLTRWINSQQSLWETTPGANSSLGHLIQQTLLISGVKIPNDRQEAILSTTVTIVSVMVDLAIEEKDEVKASATMDELVILLTKYFN